VLDTGIGPTILTETLARDVGSTANGETLTGKRMSGQEVGVPLAEAPPIALGLYVREGHAVGLLDTSGFPDALAGIDGFLSLAFFEETAFTVDYGRSVVVVETPEALAGRAAAGVAVPVGWSVSTPPSSPSCPWPCPGSGRSRSRSTWAATR